LFHPNWHFPTHQFHPNWSNCIIMQQQFKGLKGDSLTQ
jgi:hypothetical protein